MNYKYYILLTFLIIVFVVWIIFKLNPTTLNINIIPHISFFKYKDIYTDVQNVKYTSLKEKRFGDDTFWVRQSIRKNLEEMGFAIFYSIYSKEKQKSADMVVRCNFENGWGIPIFVRHFKVRANFIKSIKITFVDASTKSIIAEVNFYKNFFDRGNHLDDINKIFTELKKELKKKKEKNR